MTYTFPGIYWDNFIYWYSWTASHIIDLIDGGKRGIAIDSSGKNEDADGDPETIYVGSCVRRIEMMLLVMVLIIRRLLKVRSFEVMSSKRWLTKNYNSCTKNRRIPYFTFIVFYCIFFKKQKKYEKY